MIVLVDLLFFSSFNSQKCTSDSGLKVFVSVYYAPKNLRELEFLYLSMIALMRELIMMKSVGEVNVYLGYTSVYLPMECG